MVGHNRYDVATGLEHSRLGMAFATHVPDLRHEPPRSGDDNPGPGPAVGYEDCGRLPGSGADRVLARGHDRAVLVLAVDVLVQQVVARQPRERDLPAALQ